MISHASPLAWIISVRIKRAFINRYKHCQTSAACVCFCRTGVIKYFPCTVTKVTWDRPMLWNLAKVLFVLVVLLRPEGPSEHAQTLQHALYRTAASKTRVACCKEGYSPAQTNTGEKSCAAIKTQDFSPTYHRREPVMLHYCLPRGRWNLPHLDSTEWN